MSGVLTAAALATLIGQCGAPVPPAILTAIVQQESAGMPSAIHHNQDADGAGRPYGPIKSTDYGLMQINSKNLPWLGETPVTIMDPCRNIRAAARLLTDFSRYNTGSPTAGIDNGYALAVWQRMRAADHAESGDVPPPSTPSEPTNNTWDVFAAASGEQFVFNKGSP